MTDTPTGRPRKLPDVQQLLRLIREGYSADEVGAMYDATGQAVAYQLRRHLDLRVTDVRPNVRHAPILARVDPVDGFTYDGDTSWKDDGRCREADPDSFFPEDIVDRLDRRAAVKVARRVCLGCEVRAECLTYALAADERFGIWGGKTRRQRNRHLKTLDRQQESA